MSETPMTGRAFRGDLSVGLPPECSTWKDAEEFCAFLERKLAAKDKELAEEREAEQSPCIWIEDYLEAGQFKCGCGGYTMWDDDPREIGVKFCGFCGHPIKYQKQTSQEAGEVQGE